MTLCIVLINAHGLSIERHCGLKADSDIFHVVSDNREKTMLLAIFHFNPQPFVTEFKLRFSEFKIPPAFPEVCILSILHNHCILSLDGMAYAKYARLGTNVMDRVDDVVESMVIGSELNEVETNYWRYLSDICKGGHTVIDVKFRHTDIYEVYFEKS